MDVTVGTMKQYSVFVFKQHTYMSQWTWKWAFGVGRRGGSPISLLNYTVARNCPSSAGPVVPATGTIIRHNEVWNSELHSLVCLKTLIMQWNFPKKKALRTTIKLSWLNLVRLFLGQKFVRKRLSRDNFKEKKVTTLSATEGRWNFYLLFPCHLISVSSCVLTWV